jgi:hypothetical protein
MLFERILKCWDALGLAGDCSAETLDAWVDHLKLGLKLEIKEFDRQSYKEITHRDIEAHQ